jgi:hypothetical protein
MNIIKHYLKNKQPKSLKLKYKKGKAGLTYEENRYLPSFTKEWKNTIYSFDKKVLSDLPIITKNINKIIRSYFDLYFKVRSFPFNQTFILLKRRRNFLRKIFSSNAEIKHTNNKVIITLYVLNRERNILEKKYEIINKKVNNKLTNNFFKLYKIRLKKLHKTFTLLKNKYRFFPSLVRRNIFIKTEILYFNKFNTIKNIYLKKIWIKLLTYYLDFYVYFLRKYHLLYSLNNYKFNKVNMLWVLSSILNKLGILKNKKIEYNIVNLKNITLNPDLFTNVLSLKLKRIKIRRLKELVKVIKRSNLPRVNSIFEERTTKPRVIRQKIPGISVTPLLNSKKGININKFLKTFNKNTWNSFQITNHIFDSIKYKTLRGIKIEIKGRLTKRYRADRSIYSLRWKGGLKNIDSSYRKLSTTLLRGNVKPNTSYSLTASKRRIGAFAVKGWTASR